MAHNWKRQASLAYGCALTRLALNAYLFFEERADSCEERLLWQEKLDGRFMKLLGDFISEGNPEILKELGDFRNQVRGEMDRIMAYSDGFKIYEYALNRAERRFIKGRVIDVEEKAFVGNLMRYIASSKDGAVQNQRIQQIVGQLPVRFTRQKYFGMVHDGLTTYIGSDHAGLGDMMYLLKSGSMAGLLEEQREEYMEFHEILAELGQLSFKQLDAAAYERAVGQVLSAAQKLTALSGYCVNMQEMANDLYILCLTRQDAVREASEEGNGAAILKGLWQQYEQGSQEIPAELTESLPRLEGIQEEYSEKYQHLDFHWEDGKGKKGAEKESAERGQLVDLLMSGSTFVSLEKDKKSGNVTREDVEKAADGFFASVDPVFSSCQKPVMRAIMAITLSYLPVFFHSPDELQAYIQNSLGCCTDQAEKETCMELLLQLMEIDGYELV